MIFTACQEDTLVKEQQQNDKIYTLSATMDGGTASRAQIVIGNEAEASAGEIFMWNKDDSFDMYQYQNGEWEKSTFTISDDYSESGENRTSATFSSRTPIVANARYKAFYPVSQLPNGISHTIADEIDFTGKEPAAVWKDYFRNNMLMMKEGAFSGSENQQVNFEHLCALARITYTNKTGSSQTVNSVYLNGYHPDAFGTSYNYNVRNQENSGSTGNRCELNITGLTIKNNESVDFYLLFFPKPFVEEGRLQVGITCAMSDGSENHMRTNDISVSIISQANKNASGFEAGKRYWFKVTQTDRGLLWSSKYKEVVKSVSTVNELQEAVENYEVTHIEVMNPLVFEGEYTNLSLYEKTIRLSKDFEWGESDAVFENKCKNFNVYGGCIEGSTSQTGKYLVKSTNGSLNIGSTSFYADGQMNAIKSENSSDLYINLGENSTIDVAAGCYALSITTTEDDLCNILIYDGTINGNIYYENNYADAKRPSIFEVHGATIKGGLDISKSTYPGYLSIKFLEGAVVPDAMKPETIELGSTEERFAELIASDFYYFTETVENKVLINKAFAESLSTLELDRRGLNNMDRISIFKNLKTLKVNGNHLQSLDVPTTITHLECEDNRLTELDLTECTNNNIYILCGNQGKSSEENLTITLKLTDSMKSYWKSTLYKEGNNGVRVRIDGESGIVVPSINKENW